jgi:hypothetical protein
MTAYATPPKPWSVAVFETHRSEMTLFVRNDILPRLEDIECRRILVHAPVKSGKREMVEYIAMRDSVASPTRVHVFISAWHRKADNEQRVELGMQNIKVFSLTGRTAEKQLSDCSVWIDQQIASGLKVVVHMDECDHGSGEKQTLSDLWRKIRDNVNICNVLYSATPQEVLYSGEVDNPDLNATVEEILDGHHVIYEPPRGYCGPAKFLEENLVHVAFPFFEKEGGAFALSAQGKHIISDLKAAILTQPRRNLVVLRLSYGEGGTAREHKAVHQFIKHCGSFPELQGFDIVADVDDSLDSRESSVIKSTVEWSNPVYWRRNMPIEVPTIIIIDQKSSRSTEWACHDRIFATHDFRNTARFSTISQAVERVNHYEQRYGGFQPIRVYCHKKTLLLSAKKIEYGDYCKRTWVKEKVRGVDLYTVRHADTRATHPACPGAVDSRTGDRVLQMEECFADTSLSARVAGKVEMRIIHETTFYPVTDEEWHEFTHSPTSPLRLGRAVTRSFSNPFTISYTRSGLCPETGRWRGYLPSQRGQPPWRVLEFERDLENLYSWGGEKRDGLLLDHRIICYNRGVLGVAVRTDTGRREEVSRLEASRSMYGPQRQPRRRFRLRVGGAVNDE